MFKFSDALVINLGFLLKIILLCNCFLSFTSNVLSDETAFDIRSPILHDFHQNRSNARNLLKKAVEEEPASKDSSCSCYHVENKIYGAASQPLCVCTNVFFDGKTHLFIGVEGPYPICVEATEAVAGGVLTPVPCDNVKQFHDALKTVFTQHKRPLPEMRSRAWLQQNIGAERKEGLTVLLELSRDCVNVAHLSGKLFPLLLFNNPGLVAGFATRVDRVMLGIKKTAKNVLTKNPDSYHTGLLSNVLRAMFERDERVSVGELETASILKLVDFPSGVVDFGSSFHTASEDAPLAFDRLAMPTELRGMAFPAGALAREQFMCKVVANLQIPTLIPTLTQTRQVRVIWSRRTSLRNRVFLPESLEALRTLLRSIHSLEVIMATGVVEFEFGTMTFKEQVKEIREGDIFFSIHGANMIPAMTFGKPDLLVIEVLPFRSITDMYFCMSRSSELTYMMHQCHQGKRQEKDDEYANLTRHVCAMSENPLCKAYFVHLRKLELTEKDLASLKKLFELAIQMVGVKRDHDPKSAMQEIESMYHENCLEVTTMERNCRQSFISSPDVGRGKICLLSKDC